MNITDELREYAHDCCARTDDAIHAIADRIDAAHRAALEKVSTTAFDEGFASADDWLADNKEAMAEHGWIELPKDADGVPIRVGDKVYQVEGGWVYTVKSITFYPDNTTISFECKHGFGCDNAHNVRHYHEPTVEDVLHQFLGECENAINLGYDEVPHEVFAEYAAKLRLADDGKEQ